MAIDASIIGGLKQFQPESPIDNYGKMMTLQSLMQKSQMGDFELQEAQTKRRNTNSIADLYQQNVAADGTVNRQGIYSGAAQRGLGDHIAGIQKGFNEQDKSARESEKARLEGVVQKLEVGGRLLGGVTDQASYDSARTAAQGYGLDVSRMPPQYDPAFVASKLNESLSASERVKQQHQDLVFGETKRSNQAKEAGVTAGQVSTATTAANALANNANTAEMTDDRAREFNATKVEENKIKRETKDEATALTKSSQLASFDTMLGTLDRLGKHPGLSNSVGMIGALPTRPGSDSATFQAELNTFQSQAFLPMVAQLKGMGALSDAEGKKLTAAVGALDPKMGEKAFRDSIARINDDMYAARARLAGKTGSAPPAMQSAAPKSGVVQDGYTFMGGDPSKPTSWKKVGS